MIASPYSIVTGQGLGVSYSSLQQVGDIFPAKEFGQGKVKIHVNVANGNLVVFDHVCRLVEANGPLEFYYVFNHQPNNQWCLAADARRFKQLPNPSQPNIPGILIELDGHETSYIYDPVQKKYKAPGLNNGTPYLIYDNNNNQWQWYHPYTKITEIYDAAGLLRKKYDEEGRTSTYEYDTGSRLSAIMGASGTRYEIYYTPTNVSIYLVRDDQHRSQLANYLFENGQLTESQVGDYKINYVYPANQLTYILQSDGTRCTFGYTGENHAFVDVIYAGKNSRTRFDYSQPLQVSISDPNFQLTKIYMDSASRITQVDRQTGYSNLDKAIDTTKYTYTQSGQLESVIDPDHGVTENTYDPLFDLRIKKKAPNNQTIQYFYGQSDQPELFAQAKTLTDDIQAVTYFIYDDNYDKKGHRFLRFEISPEGRVIEYVPFINSQLDGYGYPQYKKIYLTNFFKRDNSEPTPISLLDMLTWVSAQNPQEIGLNGYFYDERGQCSVIKTYAEIDAKGKGMPQGMGYTSQFKDEFGNLKVLAEQQTDTTYTTTSQKFDALQRRVDLFDPLNYNTHDDYITDPSIPLQIKETYPNKQVNLKQLDQLGLVSSNKNISDLLQQTRETKYSRDLIGQVIVTTLPDKTLIISFYDRQNRLGFTVSQLGRVIEYQENVQQHYRATIEYNYNVDVKALFPIPTLLPQLSILQEQLAAQDHSLDRIHYEFLDLSGRVQYEVDADNYVIENRYDLANRVIGKIHYDDPLTEQQLQNLKQGGAITLIPDSNKDRWWQYFYDKDDNLLVEQDPAGYVIEKKYDAGNRCYEKISYATKTEHKPNVNDVMPPVNSEKDAHTYYYYNARSQCTLEVDPENYVTTHAYNPCGLAKQATRYATPLHKLWRDNNNLPVPTPSSEDQKSTYEYDEKNRLVKSSLPFNKIAEKNYDSMDSTLLNKAYDGTVKGGFDDDTLRAHAMLYDQFEQLTKESDTENPEQQFYEHKYDDTGLKIKSINPLGHPIYYFYDLDRRPTVVINARGAIIETTLNSFNEITEMRKYDQKISPTDLLLLTGGFITPEFRTTLNALQQADKDAITCYVRNKRGLAEKIIDPENYVTQKTYTAFKQPDEEILPLSQTTYYKIKHEYEIRGLEAKTAKIASDNQEITHDHYEYNNQFGAKTAHYDALDNKTQFINDRLGRTVQVIDPENVTRETLVLDGFDRVITNTNSLSQATTHVYNQATRSQQTIYPKGNSELVIKNVFSENVSHEDGVNNKETWRHESAGKATQHAQEVPSEAKNYVIEDGYDVIHLQNSHIDANKNQTKFVNNSVGSLEQIIVDPDNAKLITQFELDAWERRTLEIDPLEHRTSNVHDKRNLLTQQIVDPIPVGAPIDEANTHLNLTHTTQYNGQQKKSFEMQGITPLDNIYNAAFEQDAINRDIGKVIDLPPPGKGEPLNLTSTLKLDAVNQVVATIDEHDYITYYFYDKCGRERFKVDPENGVIEKRYNTEGDVIYECHYKSILTQPISEQTTLAQMVDFATNLHNLEDKELWFFYDENRLESFTLNNLGAVTEKRYDNADRKVADIMYATKVDVTKAKNNTTSQMAALMKANPSPLDRRTTYILSPCIITGKRLERFKIDPEGYVLESRFDDNGNSITEILYAQKAPTPEQLTTLSEAEIFTRSQSNDPNNATTFTVYDVRNNPIYRVYPEGNVTFYAYDKNSNMTLECRFGHKLEPVPQDYAVLVSTLKTAEWTPDKTKGDRISTFEYDAANRRCKVTDPRGNSEEFTYDAMGNKLTHTDKNKAVWSYLYDRDNREIAYTSPKSTITLVSYSPVFGNTGQLSATEDEVPVTRQKIYNKENNSITVIEGAGRSDAREMTTYYNKCNKPLRIEVPRAAVDNPNAQVDFKNPPVIVGPVTSGFIYDGKCQLVVSTDEAGNVTFFVHDSMGNQRFVIDGEGSITETQFDAFNKSTQETKYAKSLDPVKLKNDYASKGITLATMTDLMVGIPDITKDRTTKFKRDRRDNITLEEKGPIFYYCANEVKPDDWNSGTALTQFKKDYNARGKCCLESKLINPDTKTWATTLYWFDRNGNKVATVNPDLYVIIDIMNSFNEEREHREYANALSESPDPAMSVAALIEKVIQNPAKDRITKTKYNPNGFAEKITYVNADFQKLIKQDEFYTLVDVTSDLDILQTYTPTDKLDSVTDARKNTYSIYYDQRDMEIARTGVPRESLDDNDKPLTLVPLTYYGVNFAGERVRTRRFKQGAAYPLIDTPPARKKADPEDQEELILNNSQGNPAFTQDAQRTLFAMTYTATQKQARRWHQLSNWQFDPKLVLQFRSVSVMAEKRSGYDRRNLLLVTAFYTTTYEPMSKSELVLDRSTYRLRDSFGQIIAEGRDGITYPLRAEFDLVGHVWKTNAGKGAYYLKLQNAAQQDTLTLRSPWTDFESLSYKELSEVMTMDMGQAERTELARSLSGNIIAEILPAYFEDVNMQSLPVPLCMQPVQQQTDNGPQFLITFPLPQERAYRLKFLIKTHGGGVQTELPIIIQGEELRAVDVSHLATDLYDYELLYQITVPGKPEPIVAYKTQGTVQFDSNNTTTSHNLVALSASDTTVKLTGKTAGLTRLELWQGTQKIADLSYQGETLLDLSAYPSGAYTLHPFYSAIAGAPTLAFTLYTPIAAPAPLSREIDFSIALSIEAQTATVTRQINPSFADKTLRLICDYVGIDAEPYQQSVTLTPLDNQFSFDHEVKSIASLSVDLAMPPSVNEQETLWIPLLIAAVPEDQTAPKRKGARRYQALFPDAKGQLTQAKYFERTRLQHADIFAALGTSAADFVTTLRNLNPGIAAPALAQEIIEALDSGRFISSQDAAWQTLQQQHHLQQAVMKKLIQRLEIALDCDVYHLDSQGVYALLQNNDQMVFLKEYLRAEVALADCERELINFCHDKAVVAEYISFLTTHFPGDKSVLLYAKAKNIPITCWAANKANPTQMKMLGDEASTPDSQHLFIHHGQVYASLREVGKPQSAKPKPAELNEDSDWVVVDNPDKNLNEWLDLKSGKSVQIVNAVFAPRTLLYITPFAPFTEMPTVTFLDMSLDRKAQIAYLTPLPLITDTLQSVVLDVSDMPVGLYPYKVASYENLFSITRGNPVYPSQSYPTKIDGSFTPVLTDVKKTTIHPIRYYTYNAWSHKLQEVNAIGAVTNREYNFRDQEKKTIESPVSCYEEEIINGYVKYTLSATPLRPTTYHGYDESGHFIGMTNPKGNTSGIKVDAAGQEVEEYLADGTRTRQNVFDALGRTSRYQDMTDAWWHQYFNHNNHITKLSSPEKIDQFFGYNELNIGNYDADANRTYRRNYDATGFMEAYFQPLGEITILTKDRNDRVLHITYPDGTSLEYTRNYFGLEQTHTDLSGAEYTSAYNYVGLLVIRSGRGGDHGQGLLVHRVSINTDNGPEWHISAYVTAVANFILKRRYLASRLTSEESNGVTTEYGLDEEGRLVQRILTIQDDSSVTSKRTQHNYLDLLTRDIRLTDDNLTLTPGYDLNSNRVHLNSRLTIKHKKLFDKESWNTFSQTDNELISGGTVVNGFVTVGEGYEFRYAKGLRRTELHNNITSTLGYNKDKLLTSINRPDGNLTRVFNASNDLSQITTSNNEQFDFRYDRNGWSTGQTYYKDTNVVTQVDYTEISKRGYPIVQHTKNYVKSNSDNNNDRGETLVVDIVTNEYAKWDEPTLKKASGRRIESPLTEEGPQTITPLPRGGTPYQAATAYFNADGSTRAITGQQDETDPKAKYPPLVAFQNTAAKSIFTKDIYTGFGDPEGLQLKGSESHFLSTQDQNLGVFNTTTGAASLNLVRRAVTDHGGVEVGNASQWRGENSEFTPMSDPAGPYVEERHLSSAQKLQATLDKRKHKGDNSSNLIITAPAIARQNVSVVQNDTSDSLAMKMTGSESYSDQITQANGLVDSSSLFAGYPGLHIPAPLPTKNQAFMRTPYYLFTQKILGAIYPHLKTPEHKLHPNPMVIFGKTVIAVLAVVAANMIAPMLAGALMPLMFSAMGVSMVGSATLVLGGVMATLIDAAGQELLVGLHAQAEVSWREAAMVGVSSVVGGGVNMGFSQMKLLTPLAKEVLRRATLAVTQQLSEMMINHTPFDMRVVGLSILLADGESQGVTKLPSLSHLT
ncbi:MAG: RHS repeat protein, partial [Gammaproteobacteria bacterium]|nr:RHS repeat protein [Gammaproteobacteria bacterium]